MAAAQAFPIAAGLVFGLSTTNGVPGGPGQFKGFALHETGGAAASVKVYDNASAGSGTLLLTIAFGAGESAGDYFPDNGVAFGKGLFAVITGTVEGSLYVG